MKLDIRKLVDHRQFAIPFICAALLAATWPIASDGDLYIHLKLGELISQAHHWIANDVFSYSDAGRPEETASWLAEWWFWILYRLGGEAALRVFHFAVVAVILTLAARRAGVFGACLALIVHHEVMSFRPLIFGELGFALFFFLDLKGPALLLMIALWSNLHASVVGIVPFVFLRNWKLGLLALPASFCNPQGPAIWSYAVHVAQLGKTLGVGEWRSIFSPEWILLPRWVLIGWLLTRARDLESLVLIALAIVCRRHAAYLIYPVVALSGRRPAVIGIALLLAFAIWRMPAGIPSIERAAKFVHGNVFNYPGWGSYLVFKRWPEVKVAHTMRLAVHEDIYLYERDHGFAEVIARRLPDTEMVILPVTDPIRAQLSAREWKLVYEDDVALVAERLNMRSRATRE